jgi:trans-aconitate methyltransferase
MSQNLPEWGQDTSDLYRRLAKVAVPARAEQIAVLLSLLPFGVDEPFRVVELASGEGRLSQAVMLAYPHARLLALDGEPSMRQETAARLAPFGDRATTGLFNLEHPDWYPQVEGAHVVISSLCVHHLDGQGKRTLFGEVYRRLIRPAALLLADLIAPYREEARALYAATWDQSAQEQSGDTDLYERFVETQWNYFHFPDPYDKPSPLFDQLAWLKATGFEVVDCFWLRAGHAIYGGYAGGHKVNGSRLDFSQAMQIAQQVLSD